MVGLAEYEGHDAEGKPDRELNMQPAREAPRESQSSQQTKASNECDHCGDAVKRDPRLSLVLRRKGGRCEGCEEQKQRHDM